MKTVLLFSFLLFSVFLFQFFFLSSRIGAETEEFRSLCEGEDFKCTEKRLKFLSQAQFQYHLDKEYLKKNLESSLESLKNTRAQEWQKSVFLSLHKEQIRRDDEFRMHFIQRDFNGTSSSQLEDHVFHEVLDLEKLLRFDRANSNQWSERIFSQKQEEVLQFVSFFTSQDRVISIGQRTLRVFDWVRASELFSFSHEEVIQDFSFSRNGERMLTGSGSLVRLFDLKQGQELLSYSFNGSISSVALSDGGEKMVLGIRGTIYLFEFVEKSGSLIAEEKDRFNLEDLKGSISNLIFLSGEKRILLSTQKDRARFLNLETGEKMFFFIEEPLLELKLSKRGLRALARTQNRIHLLDLEEGTEIRSFSGGDQSVVFFLSQDGREGVIGNKGGRLHVFASGREEVQWSQPSEIASLSLSPEGDYILTGGEDGSFRVFDLETESLIYRHFHGGEVERISMSKDGRFVITYSHQRLNIFELKRVCQ